MLLFVTQKYNKVYHVYCAVKFEPADKFEKQNFTPMRHGISVLVRPLISSLAPYAYQDELTAMFFTGDMSSVYMV